MLCHVNVLSIVTQMITQCHVNDLVSTFESEIHRCGSSGKRHQVYTLKGSGFNTYFVTFL